MYFRKINHLCVFRKGKGSQAKVSEGKQLIDSINYVKRERVKE